MPIGREERGGERLGAVPSRFVRGALARLTAQAFVTLDADGRITGWNVGARRLTGWHAREVLGATLDRFYPEVARAAGEPAGALARARERGGVELEGWCPRKDGSRFWAVADIVPVMLGRHLRGYAVLARDATARRQAEWELESAIRVREEVLAVVSHDLKSPLNALRLGVRLLQKRAEDEGRDDAERRQLTLLERAVDRMDGLVGDLLDMSRLRAGRLQLTRAAENVPPLVEEALSEATPEARERGVNVRLAGPVPDVTVRCDRRRILQVFANLVGNAVKFGGAGGGVTLGAEATEDAVRFTIRDTGPGIPPEDLPHLFEPYWSAEGGRKLGTGLGLFIVRGIVDAHGGKLGVESVLGAGTTFWFTLPRAETA
jgi:two-component system CheB/CheR fusion protein